MALAPTPAAPPLPAEAAPPDAKLASRLPRECIATICRNPGGTYMLYAGDRPEGMEGEEGAPEGQTFETPQALLKGVMELLNDSGGAEDSFGKGFRGEADAAPAEPAAPMPEM